MPAAQCPKSSGDAGGRASPDAGATVGNLTPLAQPGDRR